MIIVLIVAVLTALSVASGLAAVLKEPPGTDGRPVSGKRRLALFCAGFFGWPFVLAFALFLLVFCWDLMYYEDRIEEVERMLREEGILGD